MGGLPENSAPDLEKGDAHRDAVAANAPEVQQQQQQKQPDAAANAPELAAPAAAPQKDHAPDLQERSSSSHNGGRDDSEKIPAVETKDNVAEPRSHGLVPPAIIANMTPEYRAELEKRLVRKIDIRLMPAIIIMYILNYIDRNNMPSAQLAGMKEELGYSSTEFNTAVSILFVGYLLMQVPSNLFLNKIGKPAIYLPACMMVWGLISALTATCHNIGGLYAIRFFLGFVEAAYFPGCLYYLSCWYTRKELGFRTAVLYSGALISGAFSGLIAAGIAGNMDGAQGLRAWRWLFIIEGVITIAIAIGAFWVLPNFPRTTSWLSEEERAIAIWRLEEDIGEDDWVGSEEQTFWQGAKMAFEDVKTYILLVIVFSIVSAGGVTNFFPIVVKTLGYANVPTLLLSSPPYVLAVITTYVNAWHADKTGERFWHVSGPMAVAVIAYIIAATTHTTGPRYFAIMLMPGSVYAAFVVALAWISNTMPRPPAKRAAALAFINAVSNTSSIFVSYMYADYMAPGYVVAFTVNCIFSFLAIVGAVVLRFVLVRLNRKLEAGIHVPGAINAIPGQAAEHGFRFKV